MCGIAGFLEFQKPSASLDDLIRMQKSLAHRGPNDRGHFFTPGVGLAHTRLSIIDLSQKAHQPMVKNGLTLIYNGEVYNLKTLRSELEHLGIRFESTSDTEVVLEAYRVWGKDSFLKLNGMFAFAILDNKKNELTLVRDRLGIKPLVYHTSGRHLVFASEIKALRQYPGFTRELSAAGVEDYFRFGHTTGAQTIWKGCLRLMPGESLTADLKTGRLSKVFYWRPELSNDCPGNFDRTVDALKKVLLTEFDQSMVSDVPVGVCISGGVDSNILASILSKDLGYKLKTFSLGSLSTAFSENRQAEKIAKLLGTDHTSIEADPAANRMDLLRTIEHYDEPEADQNILSFRLIAKEAKRQGVPVLLSGMGADEAFFGYPWGPRAIKMKQAFFVPAAIRRLIPRAWFHHSNKAYKALEVLQAKNYMTGIMNFYGKQFCDDELSQLLVNGTSVEENYFLRLVRTHHESGLPLLDNFLLCDLQCYLPNNGLFMTDLSTMAEGIEMRVPYLNSGVIDFALRVPANMHLHHGQLKALLRAIERQYIPEDVILKEKRGFYSFDRNYWLKGALKAEVTKVLSKETIERQGILHFPYVDRLLSLNAHSNVNFSAKVWNLFVFQSWLSKNL